MRGHVGRAAQSGSASSTWVFAFRLLVQEADGYLKKSAVLVVTFVLISSSLIIVSPVLLKLIVDRLDAPGTMSGSYLAVGLFIGAYAACQWLARSIGELRSLAFGRVDQRLHRRLSSRLFKHVMSLPLRFHADRKTGALSQTLTNSLLGYRLLVQHMMLTVLPVALELAMMSTVLLLLGQPALLGIIFGTLVCYTIAFAFGAVRLTEPARAVSTAHIDANALLTDSVINYETIKAFCAEPHIHQRMDFALARTEAHWIQFFFRKMHNGLLVTTLFAISVGATGFLAANEVQHGRMGLGDFVLVNTYMLQILRPMEMLGFAFRDIAQGMAFIEKMIDVFRQQPEQAARAHSRRLPPGRGELVFDNVSFSYSRERPLLQNVSFRVAAGKTIALVGASGCGKSSLIRLLIRFYEPDSGAILLDGLAISAIAAASLREAIAVVPQNTALFNDSIAYNISIGHIDCPSRDIIQAAQLAKLHECILARPEGYKALIGERGLKLSGGEKQRLAIARAALKKPRIFVFDEATSSLDSKTEKQILHNIREVSKGTTTLVVAHRLSTVIDVDEILVLERGTIIERGSHRELLRHRGAYNEMWNAQQHPHESHHAKAV